MMYYRCPVCGASEPLVRETRITSMIYKGKILYYYQSGDWCSSCGDAVLTKVDIDLAEPLIKKFMEQVDLEVPDKKLPGKKITALRKNIRHLQEAYEFQINTTERYMWESYYWRLKFQTETGQFGKIEDHEKTFDRLWEQFKIWRKEENSRKKWKKNVHCTCGETTDSTKD